ncbi:MAG: envelope stress response membrane protein PspC [Desulfobacterales bacterium]|nr:envelope stress response membrane protein PspC [Desulfobacterales bacterium]
MKYHYKRNKHCGFRRTKGHYSRFREKVDVLAASEGIYRSRQGLFMGVCRGVAEHFNLSVFWTRTIVFILFLFTGFWPVGILYIIAGLLLKLEPVIPLENETDQEFYQSYTTSRSSAIQRIKRKFDNIDRRIQRMEHTVTSREFDF